MNDVVNVTPLAILCGENKYLPNSDWLQALKTKQQKDFLQRGFPTRKEEQWKYTDMSALAKQDFRLATKESYSLPVPSMQDTIRIVFINGYYCPNHSDLSLLPKEIILCSLAKALNSHQDLIKSFVAEYNADLYPFAALNTALMTDGLFLSVPKDISLDKTIHCIYVNTEQNDFICSPRNIIDLGKNCRITFVEEYRGDDALTYLNNSVTAIYADENAEINYHKIQSESSKAVHVANLFVNQKKNSLVKSFQLATGSRLAREDIHVSLQETGASCHLNGFYHLTADKQHIDNHLHVEHSAAHGESTMKYKGILNKKSHAVFNGKVLVQPGAKQIQAQQENHNLLLSNDAEINTKPELEIYADDIKCTHGATVGQLNDEALFYLRARGISKEDAINLLTEAFADEVLNTISDPLIKIYMQEQVATC